MAQTFPSDFKSCAVCNFWEGGRKLNAFKDQVIVDSPTSDPSWPLPMNQGERGR